MEAAFIVMFADADSDAELPHMASILATTPSGSGKAQSILALPSSRSEYAYPKHFHLSQKMTISLTDILLPRGGRQGFPFGLFPRAPNGWGPSSL